MTTKILTSAWMVLITLLMLTFIRWWDPTPVQTLRLKNFDGYQALLEKKVSDKIILYDLGEEFLKENGQWPPKRDVLGQLVENLYSQGAALVVLNILFAEEDRLGGDSDFVTTLKHNPVVGTQAASDLEGYRTVVILFHGCLSIQGQSRTSNLLQIV